MVGFLFYVNYILNKHLMIDFDVLCDFDMEIDKIKD